MKKQWLKKIRLLFEITSYTKSIRDYIHSMSREDVHNVYYEENKRQIIQKIIQLIDLLQQLLSTDGPAPELPDYEISKPDEVNLSLAELLVLFRRTLLQLQTTPPQSQDNALEILYSYFIELQGLYDLIFVSHYESDPSLVSLSPSAIEDHRKRYLALSVEVEHDPLLHEYRSIRYKDLMNISAWHHVYVVLFDLIPQYVMNMLIEWFRRTAPTRRRLSHESVQTVAELRTLLAAHPMNETTKIAVALHRHIMRVCDIWGTKFVLRWGRPVFELLVLATWCQTVKDHIVPGAHRATWQVDRLDLEHEIMSQYDWPGKIKVSGAFFMQPRIKFQMERYLIFKNRTMTVGDIVRTHELGNWMRQNSPDEFLQFFNIALGDMGVLGIRTMPEHEIVESQETEWLYAALMSFIPGGMTSPGSIIMRNTNYGLTKTQQLLQEIVFYDPRFKGSSGLLTDIHVILQSLKVLNKGRVGKALAKTESFGGLKRGY